MIGLDTNVLVRYIMQDDARQAAKATALIEGLTAERPGFVPLVALIELHWVLSSCFDLDRPQVADAIDALLRTKEIILDRADEVAKAVKTFRSSAADLADCLIASSASKAGCKQTMTFDVGAAKRSGMTLIE